MSNQKIIRAWKDAAYRESLSEAERATLPPHPAGAIEISDVDLGNIPGGVAPPETHDCSMVCSFSICPTDLCTIICPTKTLCFK
jgi:mersacidin/lichenicidin family type 2 lantibiotic